MTAAEWKEYYENPLFQTQNIYKGNDLGAVIGDGNTVFKLWSPAADSVTLNLYPEGEGGKGKAISMERKEKGVFSAAVPGNLHGTYYDYSLVIQGQKVRSADPYARGAGVNGQRSMVVDLRKTDPKGFSDDKAPERTGEIIIYEANVKEFSWDDSFEGKEELRGTYLGMAQEGTTLYGDGIHPTGLDYLKNLGVTHIQLMPVYDFGSVDERGGKEAFNWGYDPLNYNVPEGSYSSNPFDGEVRIRELKELVRRLHENGFRVIMDVVYNHTYTLDSWLQRTAPWYFYRQEADGTPSNGSDCGNDIASEREMCSRYIKESVLYWTKEYHMDGFRFDLMGLLDVELMNDIQRTLDEIYGKGEKLVYGEPWAAADSPMAQGSIPALKKNLRYLDENVGMFCDNTRDSVKGHVFEEEEAGFINGGEGFDRAILDSVTAWCGEDNEVGAKAPSQIVTYLSAHDNLTLWDKLKITLKPEGDFETLYPEILAANRLGAAILFTCQGMLFFLSGEEFGRTKEGIHDSFCSPLSLNRLDWERAYRNRNLMEYYRGLIALRKQLPGLCDKTEQAKERIFEKKIEKEGLLSFRVKNRWEGENSHWRELFVVYNSRKMTESVRLPEGSFELLADAENSFLWKSPWELSGTVELPPVSAAVLGKR